MPSLTVLPTPENWRAVLGFDFDDTLNMANCRPTLDPEFFECIRWIRARHGAAWGICTGRSLYQLVEGFNEAHFPFLPDFLVTREREIYLPGHFGRWEPNSEWNLRCEKDHHKLFRKAKRVLAKVRQFVEKETQARWVSHDGDPAGIVASTVPEMDGILEFMTTVKKPPNLTFERNGIYLRFSHHEYNKGTGLVEVAKHWGQTPETILAVGDNFNDLSMLQPEVSRMCGCPSNAVTEVREWVAERGGKVATDPGSIGVMQILGHYFKAD